MVAVAYGDSDWATCVKTRRSFSGICIQLAGGTIAYKTKFQPTVALFSTKAEFMAACDVGHMSLFVRSILWDLDIKKPLPLPTKTTMAARPWATPKNQPRAPITLKSNILPYVIGLNMTLYTLSVLTHQSILPTTSPNLFLGCSFINTPTFS
jgi:hypothetical protein